MCWARELGYNETELPMTGPQLPTPQNWIVSSFLFTLIPTYCLPVPVAVALSADVCLCPRHFCSRALQCPNRGWRPNANIVSPTAYIVTLDDDNEYR